MSSNISGFVTESGTLYQVTPPVPETMPVQSLGEVFIRRVTPSHTPTPNAMRKDGDWVRLWRYTPVREGYGIVLELQSLAQGSTKDDRTYRSTTKITEIHYDV